MARMKKALLKPMSRDGSRLARPPVVLALGMLIANDHLFKQLFPGWLTGKLSDVAGLFVLGALLAWLFPRGIPAALTVAAIGFAFWKSELSAPLIAAWNQIGVLPVARVVDFTDLLALPFLFLGARPDVPMVRLRSRSRRGDLAVALVSLLAFTATSKIYDFKLQDHGGPRSVVYDGNASDLETLLEPCGINWYRDSGKLSVYVTSEPWNDGAELRGRVSEKEARTVMTFEELWIGSQPDDVAALIDRAIQTLETCLTRPEIELPVAETRDAGHLMGGLEGAFVVLSRGQTIVHNPARAETRLPPASTFKIPNMLIALETGIVTGTEFPLPWDGKRPEEGFWAESWSRDHTLRSAIENGVLWYFQELARRIGHQRMAAYVSWFGYGNRNVSGPIDRFWLDGSLEISAREQVEFLRRFHERRLNLYWRNAAIAREVLVLETSDRYTLSGKTGSLWMPVGEQPPDRLLVWLVGWVERDEDVHIFALNLDCPDFETCDLEMRRRLAVAILDDWEILLPAEKSQVFPVK